MVIMLLLIRRNVIGRYVAYDITFQRQCVLLPIFFTECMDGLFHKIGEWCIIHSAIYTTEKLLQSSK